MIHGPIIVAIAGLLLVLWLAKRKPKTPHVVICDAAPRKAPRKKARK